MHLLLGTDVYLGLTSNSYLMYDVRVTALATQAVNKSLSHAADIFV